MNQTTFSMWGPYSLLTAHTSAGAYAAIDMALRRKSSMVHETMLMANTVLP